MNCKNHIERSAANTCSKCGEWICDDCAVELNGRIYCKECLSKTMSGDTSSSAPTSVPMATPVAVAKRREYRRKSGFFAFCCAFIPGCGQMYLGLMKRGLMFMAMEAACIYLTCFSPIFAAGIVILWFYSFFDTFNCKSRLDNGEMVKDDIDDIKRFALNNKKILLVSIIVIVFSEIFRTIRYGFFGGFNSTISNALLLIFIGIGVYLLFFKKNSKSDSSIDKQ